MFLVMGAARAGVDRSKPVKGALEAILSSVSIAQLHMYDSLDLVSFFCVAEIDCITLSTYTINIVFLISVEPFRAILIVSVVILRRSFICTTPSSHVVPIDITASAMFSFMYRISKPVHASCRRFHHFLAMGYLRFRVFQPQTSAKTHQNPSKQRNFHIMHQMPYSHSPCQTNPQHSSASPQRTSGPQTSTLAP